MVSKQEMFSRIGELLTMRPVEILAGGAAAAANRLDCSLLRWRSEIDRPR